MACKTCRGCGFVNTQTKRGVVRHTPWIDIEDKEGQRPAWKNLTRKLSKSPCPDCRGPERQVSKEPVKMTTAPPKSPVKGGGPSF